VASGLNLGDGFDSSRQRPLTGMATCKPLVYNGIMFQRHYRVKGARKGFHRRAEEVATPGCVQRWGRTMLARSPSQRDNRPRHGDVTGDAGRCGRSRLIHSEPASVRFSALVNRFIEERLPLLAPNTQRTYQISIKSFYSFFDSIGDPAIADVRTAHVRAFLSWRRTHPSQWSGTISGRTLQKDRGTLHAIFAFAEELELRDGNPVTKVAAPRADPRDPVLLNAGEYERLLAVCESDPMLKLFVLVLGETGARCESEVLWLRWEDVDFTDGFLWIASGRDGRRTKSGKGRWVPLTPRLETDLKEHFALFRSAQDSEPAVPWVFHHRTARRWAKAGDRIRSLRRAFRNAAMAAGLPPNLHQHDLRHRRVTTWLGEGKNPVHVKEAVGHSDLRTTMSYTHLSKEHLKSLVSRTAPA